MTKPRRRLLGVAALLTLALAAAPVLAALPTDNGLQNRGFTTQQRNHFGNAAKGFVNAEEWAEEDVVAPDANNIRGCSRWFVTSQAKRVLIHAVNVRRKANNEILKSTDVSKNSNGAPLVQLCTDSFNPPNLLGEVYVEVVASIRWADNTLSSGVSFASTAVTNS